MSGESVGAGRSRRCHARSLSLRDRPTAFDDVFPASGLGRFGPKWTPGHFQYSHAKFMVLDDTSLILSSANFSQSGFSTDRDFVLFDTNPRDVREADNVFRADWDRIPPVLNDSNLIVSPVNARRKLYALLARAKHSIDLYSEEVLDKGAPNWGSEAWSSGADPRRHYISMGKENTEALRGGGSVGSLDSPSIRPCQGNHRRPEAGHSLAQRIFRPRPSIAIASWASLFDDSQW